MRRFNLKEWLKDNPEPCTWSRTFSREMRDAVGVLISIGVSPNKLRNLLQQSKKP